jgi:hypothetical protein
MHFSVRASPGLHGEIHAQHQSLGGFFRGDLPFHGNEVYNAAQFAGSMSQAEESEVSRL